MRCRFLIVNCDYLGARADEDQSTSGEVSDSIKVSTPQLDETGRDPVLEKCWANYCAAREDFLLKTRTAGTIDTDAAKFLRDSAENLAVYIVRADPTETQLGKYFGRSEKEVKAMLRDLRDMCEKAKGYAEEGSGTRRVFDGEGPSPFSVPASGRAIRRNSPKKELLLQQSFERSSQASPDQGYSYGGHRPQDPPLLGRRFETPSQEQGSRERTKSPIRSDDERPYHGRSSSKSRARMDYEHETPRPDRREHRPGPRRHDSGRYMYDSYRPKYRD